MPNTLYQLKLDYFNTRLQEKGKQFKLYLDHLIGNIGWPTILQSWNAGKNNHTLHFLVNINNYLVYNNNFNAFLFLFLI